MKNLLFKEFKLSMHPTAYIFLLLGSLLLIPSYPYYVAFIYTGLSVFLIFLTGKENKDIFFTVALPIRKKDVVKARCYTVVIIELLQIIVSIPFAVISGIINPKGNLLGIDANIAFFGFVFVMYALFNVIYLPMFYKTAYKVGVPLLIAGTAISLYIIAIEVVVQLVEPLKASLDTLDPALVTRQLPVLIAGMGIYALLMVLAYKIAADLFEKIDL